MAKRDWCLVCGAKLSGDNKNTCHECVFPTKKELSRRNPMTHDQRALSAACSQILPLGHYKCDYCGRDMDTLACKEVSHRLEDHREDCPLRIVIEAALNTNTKEM